MQMYYLAMTFEGNGNYPSTQSKPGKRAKKNSEIPDNFKILIVDDDDDFRGALSHRLRKIEINAVAVESGRKALTTLKDNGFDLVLLDLVMPDMDGVETFRRIIKMRNNCFVIIMTAYHDDERIKIAKGMNPFGFIEKPFEFTQLISLIKRLKEIYDGKR